MIPAPVRWSAEVVPVIGVLVFRRCDGWLVYLFVTLFEKYFKLGMFYWPIEKWGELRLL